MTMMSHFFARCRFNSAGVTAQGPRWECPCGRGHGHKVHLPWSRCDCIAMPSHLVLKPGSRVRRATQPVVLRAARGRSPASLSSSSEFAVAVVPAKVATDPYVAAAASSDEDWDGLAARLRQAVADGEKKKTERSAAVAAPSSGSGGGRVVVKARAAVAARASSGGDEEERPPAAAKARAALAARPAPTDDSEDDRPPAAVKARATVVARPAPQDDSEGDLPPAAAKARATVVARPPPPDDGQRADWYGSISIMTFLQAESKASVQLPWCGIVIAFGSSDSPRLQEDFARWPAPSAVPYYFKDASVLEAVRPQVIAHTSVVTDVEWSTRLAWATDWEDPDEVINNQMCVVKITLHPRIRMLTETSKHALTVGIAVVSDPAGWAVGHCQEARDIFLNHRAQIVVMGWFRRLDSEDVWRGRRGRGYITRARMLEAFASDTRGYTLQDLGSDIIKTSNVFQVVPQAGTDWPMQQELSVLVKQWRGDDVAAIWIKGPKIQRSNTAKKERRKAARRRGHGSRGRGTAARDSAAGENRGRGSADRSRQRSRRSRQRSRRSRQRSRSRGGYGGNRGHGRR